MLVGCGSITSTHKNVEECPLTDVKVPWGEEKDGSCSHMFSLAVGRRESVHQLLPALPRLLSHVYLDSTAKGLLFSFFMPSL